MKKLISCLLIIFIGLSMTLTMPLSVKAVNEGYEIKITNAYDGSKFEAYQIFKGDLSENGKNTLSNIQWGNGVTQAAIEKYGDPTTKAASLKTTEDAQQFVKELLELGSYDPNVDYIQNPISYDSANRSFKVPEAGYYLIRNIEAPMDKAYSAPIMKVAGNVEVTLKTDFPTLEKKVYENFYDTPSEYDKGYNDVADYSIGDTIPFMLIGSIPDMSNYSTYDTFKFSDKTLRGLEFLGKENVHVYLSPEKKLNGVYTKEVTTEFDISTNSHGYNNQLIVEYNSRGDSRDFKTFIKEENENLNIPGLEYKYVIVVYKAKLTRDAYIGKNGNTAYESEIGNVNTAELEFTSNPTMRGSVGKTKSDRVIIYTYGLVVNKVDGNDVPLENVEFRLQNKDGKYALVEEHSSGNFVLVDWVDDSNASASILKTNDQGQIIVHGLEDGDYILKETKTLEGYDNINPITFTMNATTSNGQDWLGTTNDRLTGIDASITDHLSYASIIEEDVDNGTVTMEVVNKKSSSDIAETGGIGNYIFYGLGGFMMVVAGTYFIRKKETE